MKEERIDVVIDAQGNVSASASGFTNGQCLQDLDKILQEVKGQKSRRRPAVAMMGVVHRLRSG